MDFVELFCGVGGFRFGLEKANQESSLIGESSEWQSLRCGGNSSEFDGAARREVKGQSPYFRCVWANEWDKYACQVYRKNFGSQELVEQDIREVKTDSIPDCGLLTAGFPCPTFSLAGKRKGFQEARGTLFTQIVRVASAKRPPLLLLENVKGLLSSGGGRDFTVILRTLGNLGYLLEWQVLNSKHFGVPQNRERVFIVGHLGGAGGQQIFPVRCDGEEAPKVGQVAGTLQGRGHNGGLHSNMTAIIHQNKSGNIALHGEAQALRSGASHNYQTVVSKSARSGGRASLDRHTWDLVRVGEIWEGSQCRVYDSKGIAPTLHKSGGKTEPIIANAVDCDGYLRSGTRPRDENGKPQLLPIGYRRIRRLTPAECERLQGFPDGWTEGVSDTQRYKLLGNAVTVNVVEFLGKRLMEAVKGEVPA